jgi:hypothetical protein
VSGRYYDDGLPRIDKRCWCFGPFCLGAEPRDFQRPGTPEHPGFGAVDEAWRKAAGRESVTLTRPKDKR